MAVVTLSSLWHRLLRWTAKPIVIVVSFVVSQRLLRNHLPLLVLSLDAIE